ncbi:Fatty acid desaturase type 1 [Penicillium concentricum]|uniref:Fatty acid desaturase type 1 n=1 Tax=Penicillium concentricum TaxID=293559 RepID=A0A9W9S8R0_9EURO|nr:Fatty acid desaturase type 1 [Penicillium concentricum]KAJ5373910.1 Fatty acid desaturase type 1 [Penicillium concentricum]
MHLPVDPQLTLPDLLVIKELLRQNAQENEYSTSKDTIQKLKSLNDTSDPEFDPTVFQFWETCLLRERLPLPIRQHLLEPYIRWVQGIVRFPTDVVMVTHLLLYLTTSVPSALWLYCYHFNWIHGLLHWIVHMHHVEGNWPRDLNSTMWCDRDSIADFARYVGRFFFPISLDLPVYLLRRSQYYTSFKTAFWELSNYLAIALLFRYGQAQVTRCVFLLPLWTLRAGLMAGNWGQHAFVDPNDPLSDFRSSITLIDVASNRFCFHDGYHTSHHLHPRRHWREHPVALLQDQERYSDERALVFQNLDYLMLTVKLFRKNYAHLARCMLPIGAEQRSMTL